MQATTSSPTLRLRERAEREFRLLFAVCFMFFLVVAVAARLLPRRWRPFPPGPRGARSIFGDARAAANTSIPFVYMR